MNKNSQTALNVVAIVVGMFGLAYASVPLYDIFCRVTGFGGTTQEAATLPDKIYDREIEVLFNTEVDTELSWEFKKLQDSTKVNVGENELVFYEATNTGTEPIIGMASYNVQPSSMGKYFVKMKCFCFEQQLIRPGEKVTFPVSFFIDPSIMDDKQVEDVTDVTLSYTFYKYKEQDLEKLREQATR
jgi:cytochrome c oxidase assembly protein subunit 11